jgi:hypothetical protein
MDSAVAPSFIDRTEDLMGNLLQVPKDEAED